eukprot:CAMPEP_0177775990 /NCGR_PEP_ID=MMETSP0491_2-20121128/14441_1 /TAXON_ID=63592 /ORGANISM="Tetraselmis chuii, Strain PLY429" /LENGTH=238 /DNA_ID=CAMNT_0019294685 /DNA_START=84 /DNA_END=800 /DNA_ORIENTATION=+
MLIRSSSAGRFLSPSPAVVARRTTKPATLRPLVSHRRTVACAVTPGGGAGGSGGRSGGSGGGGGGGGDGRWYNDGSGGEWGGVALALAIACGHFALTATRASALCGIGGKAEDPPKPTETDALVDKCVDVAGPIAANLGFSGALGLASATAVKCLSATLGFAIGLGFILVQVLSHYGVITVHWSNVNERVVALADSNGDGKLDSSDYKAWGKKLLGVLSEGVPSIGGFAAGFAMGLRF